ncbi:MAG: hypothetical protein JSS20_16180 [Proteobacteria bacterium]|nr:hypothetical protein [Pseudomonadota bacterium]
MLAATVMAKLRMDFTKRIGVLEHAVRQNPGSAENWHSLAAARLQLAESGLFEVHAAGRESATARQDVEQARALERRAPPPGRIGDTGVSSPNR